MSEARTAGSVLIANPSADVYGSDLQMLESISALVAAGWKVTVAIPSTGELVAKIEQRGATVSLASFPVLRRANQSPLAFLGLLASAVISVPRIWRYVRRAKADVVYVNTITLPWWLFAARLARVRVVCHLHEAENQDSRLVRTGLLSPLLLAHAIIVISKSTMDTMTEAIPLLRRKGHLVYNGVPAPTELPLPAQRSKPFRVAVVARLSPRKAPNVALEAVGKLRAEGRDVVIELCGSVYEGYEWYEAELRARSEQDDLRGAVTFPGYTSPVWPALATADAVLAPSLREPFGNAVVEAQLARRPVVASAALGHLETIEDRRTGMLVPPDDADAMARALAELMDDPDLAESIAVSAQFEAEQRFGVERYSREILDVVSGRTR